MTTRTTLNKRMRLIEAAATGAAVANSLTAVPVKTTTNLNHHHHHHHQNHHHLPLSQLALANLTAKQTNASRVPLFTSGGGGGATAKAFPTTVPTADDYLMDTTSCFEASHPNTIVHIDIDCFYAQVEELRDPSLRTVPLGIQQKNCLVTCNYLARARGIRKLMSVQEAQKLCPELVLVRGEDLTPYRQMSSKVFEHITRQYPQLSVERLGMDENFIDVTKLVEQRLRSGVGPAAVAAAGGDGEGTTKTVIGCIYPPQDTFTTNCLCGCERRLAMGTQIADKLRESLFKELGITTCAGIAHNKMLAKLAGALNKPNNQTVVVPTRARDLMVQLKELRSIPGIGQKTESLLNEMQVTDIESLQRVDQTALVLKFGPEMAKKLKDWSHGVDQSAVRASNVRPKTIGLEDACPKQPLSVRQEIEDKFRGLLQRLLSQVAEDGRIPVAIKMTLRKYDAQRKTSHRETRQANILPTLFQWTMEPQRLTIIPGGEEKVLQIVMRLFERVIDLRLPFNVTLLGLAFSKFQEKRGGGVGGGQGSIASYLLKGGAGKKDLEVQSVTSLTSDGVSPTDLPSPVAQFHGIGRFYREHRDLETMSDTMSVASDVSEDLQSDYGGSGGNSQVEPSPKKSRLTLSFMNKRRCFGVSQQVGAAAATGAEPMDCASPSKLRVAELRLNSIDRERTGAGAAAGEEKGGVVVPQSVDPQVFRELPQDVQNELIKGWAAVAVKGEDKDKVESGIGMATRNSGKGILVAKNVKAVGGERRAATLHRYFIRSEQ